MRPRKLKLTLRSANFSKLPIIALTANVMVSQQNEFLDAGITDHIAKPIDPDRLVATLAKWVRPAWPMRSTPMNQAVHKSSAPEQLPDLPGVNGSESIRRIGGNVSLYCSLLDKFRDNQRDFAASFREALAADDLVTAERLAHTLRGIAGTLGAEALQESAGILENFIKKNESAEVDPLLARVDKELGSFIAGIDQALESRRV